MKILVNAKDAILKIWRLMTTEQRLLGVGVFVVSFFAAFLELLGVSAILPLVNALTEPDKLLEQKYIALFVNITGITDTAELIKYIIVGVILLYLFKNAFSVFNSWLRIKYSYKIVRECSVLMMRSYMERGYSFFLGNNVNELLQGAFGDVSGLFSAISSVLQIFMQLFIVIMISVYMCLADYRTAFVVVGCAVLCLLLIVFVFRKRMMIAGREMRKYAVITNKLVMEAFHGIKEVLVMRKQKYYIDEYEKNVIKRQKYQLIDGIGMEIPAYLIEGICVVGIMTMLYVRQIQGLNDGNYIAVLASFAMGAFRIMPAIGKISSEVNMLSSHMVYIDSVYNNIIKERSNNRKEDSVEAKDAPDIGDLTSFENISVRDVSFAYESGAGEPVIENVSLEIEKGQSIAIIGESGAGKSTLADIILGLLKPQKGRVMLDKTDIRSIPNAWAKKVGFVPQSIYLSDTTIRENVAFGVNEKDIDDGRMIKALKDADIYDFIMTLPDGIETTVGDRGVRLSGGQRQRIGIARALYHDPEILILDEATSALDNNTEDYVMNTINNLHGRMTLIIIAHRLSTIRNCDIIYEVKNKGVVRVDKEKIL